MNHLRWSAVGLCVMALAACDSTPVDPAATGAGPDSSGPAGGMAVIAPVFSAVPVLDDIGGHLYDAVASAGGINWANARTAARDMTSGDCRADLASITSAEENAFILENFPGAAPSIGNGYWIGGFQHPEAESPEADWMWVSGDSFGFADWADGVPDDDSPFGEEDAIHFLTVSNGGLGGEAKWNDLNQAETTPGYVVEFAGECSDEELIEVMLKLTQGEGPRNINMKSQGKIAVAVLSMADSGAGDGFDATTIDPTTVTLGDGTDPGAPVAGNPHGKLMVAWPDLDEDGLADALFHFNTQDLVSAGLTEETTELIIHGMTEDEVEFSGADQVTVMQPK
jgi:hypothetical protein